MSAIQFEALIWRLDPNAPNLTPPRMRKYTLKVNSEPISVPSANPENVTPTAGMTTKVVKGSFWTLMGQILPLAVSFLATPITIRLLGSEAYGVLILVGLIPAYFSFADFGMGIASTKFGSEAYGQSDREKEAEIVRTAALITLCSSMAVVLPIIVFSSSIVSAFNVPDDLVATASYALKVTAVAFPIGVLGSVVNSPMLARLRMDLNALTSAVPKIMMMGLTPLVIFLGGGIIGASFVSFFASILILFGAIYFSRKLLPGLISWRINRKYLRPLLKFGGAWVIAVFATTAMVNFEKLLLPRLLSVESLAYYSVAFTFANMATLSAIAMVQSLIPAFSQLLLPERRSEFNALFERTIRLNLVLLPPVTMILFLIARPFFTIWAGEDFGRESTVPFYLLLAGLFINLVAYIPYCTITASGRTDILAKLSWIELPLFGIGTLALINYFGLIGAALAWSIRVIIDAFVVIELAKRYIGIRFSVRKHFGNLLVGISILSPPMLFAGLYDNYSYWLLPITFGCIGVYLAFAWNVLIEDNEKRWLEKKLQILPMKILGG